MKMALKAAFIFVAPEADAKKHRAVVNTPEIELTVVGVKNYQMATEAAKELVKEGIGAIELCGGFGIEGTAAVKKAVEGKAVIGVVRFDNHPGLQFKSGDELF
jgi:antirestriction protein ArdC